MNRDEHIDNVLNSKIRPLLEEASDVIEALKPGEKIPATELAKVIAERHGMTGPQLYPVLIMMFKDYPGVEIKRGAHGGIYRPLPIKE
jgi:hypothetical protein